MLINKSKNTVISKKIYSKTGLSKILGLMGKNSPEPIFFKTRFGIHTFFLNFPIDLIVIDENKKVIVAKNVLPNKIIFWNIKYNNIIELPNGSLKKSNTSKNDILEIIL